MQLVDAINQVFTLFRLNYHNQYLKAFGNTTELNEVKRLWLEMLGRFEPQALLKAAKFIIETSEFLPTLHTMIHHCEKASAQTSLPDAHSAYIEACRAPSPKADFKWSHPAVYHAGKRCDWFFLQSNAEAVAFPVFKSKYEEVCHEVRQGVKLAEPRVQVIEEKKPPAMEKSKSRERLDSLRAKLEL